MISRSWIVADAGGKSQPDHLAGHGPFRPHPVGLIAHAGDDQANPSGIKMRRQRIFRPAEAAHQNPGQAVADYARQGANTAGSNTDALRRMINRTPAKPNAAAHWTFPTLSLGSGAESTVIAVISKGGKK